MARKTSTRGNVPSAKASGAALQVIASKRTDSLASATSRPVTVIMPNASWRFRARLMIVSTEPVVP